MDLLKQRLDHCSVRCIGGEQAIVRVLPELQVAAFEWNSEL